MQIKKAPLRVPFLLQKRSIRRGLVPKKAEIAWKHSVGFSRYVYLFLLMGLNIPISLLQGSSFKSYAAWPPVG